MRNIILLILLSLVLVSCNNIDIEKAPAEDSVDIIEEDSVEVPEQVKECKFEEFPDEWMGTGILCNSKPECEEIIESIGTSDVPKEDMYCKPTTYKKFITQSGYLVCSENEDCQRLFLMAAYRYESIKDMERGIPDDEVKQKIISMAKLHKESVRCHKNFCEGSEGALSFTETYTGVFKSKR